MNIRKRILAIGAVVGMCMSRQTNALNVANGLALMPFAMVVILYQDEHHPLIEATCLLAYFAVFCRYATRAYNAAIVV